jgi:type IV pilus assembly protein PilC
MVHAGEVGGILDTILERLSAYLEASEKLRGKVKGALAYPAIVVVIALGVSIFLLTVVIPVFAKMFESFGSQLPLPTQMLINISGLIRKYFYIVISLPIAVVIIFRRWYATEPGRRYVDRISLKLPIFGVLLQKTAIARFSQTLSTLVKSGVPILQALDTVAKTAGNKIVEEAIQKARESIREGERISEPLKKSGVFPPMVTQMIAIGEETGNLDAMLSKIAEFYTAEVDAAVSALTSMIEPLLILFLGIVVGGIVIAMYLPMFSVGSLISGAG